MYDELIKRLRNEAETERYLLPHSDNGTAALLDESADAIEELSHDYEKLAEDFNGAVELLRKRENPRWIPVTERLPEKYHQVLVYGLNGMQIDYYAGEKSIGGRPLFMISEAKVTHWQPLPELPKEES